MRVPWGIPSEPPSLPRHEKGPFFGCSAGPGGPTSSLRWRRVQLWQKKWPRRSRARVVRNNSRSFLLHPSRLSNDWYLSPSILSRVWLHSARVAASTGERYNVIISSISSGKSTRPIPGFFCVCSFALLGRRKWGKSQFAGSFWMVSDFH